MRKFLGVVLGLVGALSLASCNTTSVTNDKLVIGMECAYQPFNWTVNSASDYTLPIANTNQFVDGYDIQVAKYLGEKLDREVVIRKLEWDTLIPELQNDGINMVLAGMTDTAERRESIDFTNPYLESDLAFLIRTEDYNAAVTKYGEGTADNPMSYENLKDLFNGKQLICQANVVGDDFIDTYFVPYGAKHSSPAQTYPSAALDVLARSAFAMPAELPVIQAMASKDGLSVLYVNYDFLSEEDQNGMKVSIGIKKGNTELCDLLNGALAELTDEMRSEMMGAAATRSAENA